VRTARTILLTIVFLAALLAFTVTYTVRFTEAAVLTTFGKAGESDVKTQPGLRWKLPYPIQSVTKYDTRVRLLTMKLETQQTSDSRQVVVETFCTWRVDNPLKFFQRFSNSGERSEEHYRAAENALKVNLRSASAVVSKYRMDELFSSSGQGSKLPELEQRMLGAFKEAPDQSGLKLSDYGIAAVDLGLTRVVLTEEVTKAVFERMKATRGTIAKETESRGQAQAQSIRDAANADAQRISEFAKRLAQDIRTRGDIESTPYLAQMNSNSELAVFLANMDFIRESMSARTTLVLSGSMPGIAMLAPDALEGMQAGQIPTLTRQNWLTQAIEAKPPAAPQRAPAGDAGTSSPGNTPSSGGQR